MSYEGLFSLSVTLSVALSSILLSDSLSEMLSEMLSEGASVGSVISELLFSEGELDSFAVIETDSLSAAFLSAHETAAEMMKSDAKNNREYLFHKWAPF